MVSDRDRSTTKRYRRPTRTCNSLVLRLIPYIFIGFILALVLDAYLTTIPLFTQTNDSPNQVDPSYKPRPARSCPAPQLHSHNYPETLTCIRVLSFTSSTLNIRLAPSILQDNNNDIPQQLSIKLDSHDMPTLTTYSKLKNSSILIYKATNLMPCTDYTLTLESHHEKHPRRRQLCSAAILSTACLPQYNLVHNPSFEQAKEPPFIATRHGTSIDQRFNPRMWTPFYDGGARRLCGFSFPFTTVGPRSGNCALVLGQESFSPHKHYGAHTTISFAEHDILSESKVLGLTIIAWTVRKTVTGHDRDKAKAKMVVSWTLNNGHASDGVSVSIPDPLNNASGKISDLEEEKWVPICIKLEYLGEGIKFSRLRDVHLFFHMDASEGEELIAKGDMLGIDDVVAYTNHLTPEPFHGIDTKKVCHLFVGDGDNEPLRRKEEKEGINKVIHLQADEMPHKGTLTLAVPLTAGRVLRLETLSKQYGGGGIAAAVAVRNEGEVMTFSKIWREKVWLWKHVNVTFVRRKDNDGALAINALRNVAVTLAQTDFVAMLDVDMTPAPDEFACMRSFDFKSNVNTYLNQLLPPPSKTKGLGKVKIGSRRLLAMAVLVPGVHEHAASNKDEARDALLQHSGFFYCINSQRASRLRQWVATENDGENSMIRQTKFLENYEPYVIGRRDEYPSYDERFCGYGFNKISWLMTADAAGWNIYALTQAFVTHLNHVENEWVSGIDEERYLQTWRRYLGLTAEVGSFTSGGSGNSRIKLISR